MKKNDFLSEVRKHLAGLSEEDIKKALDFYDEAINDRMEDGLTEDQAVAALGTPEEVAKQILMDTPLPKLVKAKAKPNRALRVWEIILIILGFPIWFPLLLTVGILALTFAIVAFVLVITFFVVVFCVGIAGIALVFAAFVLMFTGGGISMLVPIGAGLVLMGIGVLLFIPVKAFAVWILELMGRFIKWIKSLFIKNRTKEAQA